MKLTLSLRPRSRMLGLHINLNVHILACMDNLLRCRVHWLILNEVGRPGSCWLVLRLGDRVHGKWCTHGRQVKIGFRDKLRCGGCIARKKPGSVMVLRRIALLCSENLRHGWEWILLYWAIEYLSRRSSTACAKVILRIKDETLRFLMKFVYAPVGDLYLGRIV